MIHLVMTRINIRARVPHKETKKEMGTDAFWLKKRMDLTERYYLPSLASQTCQNFRVQFYLSEDSPSWLVERLVELQKVYGFLSWTFLSRWLHMGNLQHSSSLPLVTTRMDSDDVIASDFIEGVQNSIGSDSEFLSHPRGYWYKDGEVLPRYNIANQFISFVEHTDQLRTVCRGPHNTKKDARVISDLPMWCWVLHGQNISRHGHIPLNKKKKKPLSCMRDEIKRLLV